MARELARGPFFYGNPRESLRFSTLGACARGPDLKKRIGVVRFDARDSEEKPMNKGDLVAAVAEQADLNKNQAAAAVDAVLDAITSSLKSGDEVRLVGFGTFLVTDRPAGEARNPRTGETIKTKASKAPKFKAG